MIRLEMKKYNMILTEKQKNISFISGEIDKYEYLTGEEILPSYQSRIIEQAKFTYSRLGKVFVKQVKTIEDQGEKQIKTLEYHGKQLVKSISEKESSTLLKLKEIFEELSNERMGKIQNSRKQFNFNNLMYYFKRDRF